MPLYDPHSADLQPRLYDVYRELRDHHPIYHNEKRGIFVLTRYPHRGPQPDDLTESAVSDPGRAFESLILSDTQETSLPASMEQRRRIDE